MLILKDVTLRELRVLHRITKKQRFIQVLFSGINAYWDFIFFLFLVIGHKRMSKKHMKGKVMVTNPLKHLVQVWYGLVNK